jgi:hypothetical protein
MRKFFKNDKWGNHTEEKTSLDGGPFETFNSAYTYDTHNNWITKKTTNKGDGHQTTTRAIEYY